ncbi:interferon-induced very large GTPase 1-like isoform X2 [Dendropsophus ebraccatus]
MEDSKETILGKKKREDFTTLLRDLDIEKYYPQKMKTTDFRTINRATLSGAKPKENKELPTHYLQQLVVLDYGARYVHCEDNSKQSHIDTRTIVDDNTSGPSDRLGNSKSFFGTNPKIIGKQNVKQHQGIHPMDIQMAIFHCADDFMRQYLYTKLSFCQFALPLLVPDPRTRSIELPLWAFQEVKKKWHTKRDDDPEKSKSNEKFMKDTETLIVSFIRFGSSNYSKSRIMNWLMSKHRHDIFYHRNCEGSTKTSVLMDGVTDIAWYCPGGREDDAFDHCTAFVNLHGDARDHGQQLEFIQEISSVLVIIFSYDFWQDSKYISFLIQLLISPKPCIFLGQDEEFSGTYNRKKLNIGLKGKKEAELVKEVRTKIKELLLIQNEVYSLNKCAALARRHGFMVDEDKVQCKVGKEQAEKLLKLLKTEELSARKDTFLPIQGDLWLEWCRKHGGLLPPNQFSSLSIEQQRSDIKSEREILCREKLKRANSLNNFMNNFLQLLNSTKERSEMYSLQWFRMYLDELSSDPLSGLYQKYNKLRSSVKAEKEGGKNHDIIDNMEKELQKQSDEISRSTFGLEHVMRGLGQIYDALEASTQDQFIVNLPKIAANLMISGYPIELMDGDAAHVPIKWVTAILQELEDTLGDKKLFVLSALGIQSTLLIAMFGLQFAGSAGRWTSCRGAFMQLVKVEEELRKELTYDYVLVVHTEGLRSVELSSQNVLNKINELATFVIGLGNLTLINMFGENPSEMQDILQIAVRAFLRMKKVNLHPSCLFVHQNVGEITARGKNMEGRRCLLSKLDEMTLCAARQEECDVTCFNDVIQFDVQSHIHYISHLWEGDPPMAPPNPRYSQNVQTLRKFIIDSGKGKESLLSISAFRAHVSDLWNASLTEKFLLMNSLEITAYNQLEVKYCQWEWRLRERMLTLRSKINTQIQVEETKSIDMMWISSRMEEVYSKVQGELNVFFNEEKQKSILGKWRANTENRITSLKYELIAEINKIKNELITLKNKKRKTDDMDATYKDKIDSKSQGQNSNDKSLKAKFAKKWHSWITSEADGMSPPDSSEIHGDLDEILLEHFKGKVKIDTIHESYKWENLTEEFTNRRGFYIFRDVETKINRSIHVLTKRIEDYIDQKEQERMGYGRIYFHEILRIIQEEINKVFDERFGFLSDYVVYASLFFCRKAVYRFKKLSDVLLVDTISNKLQVSLKRTVYDKTAIDISKAMKRNYSALNGNRSKLELYLLKSLAEKENFQNYLTYITDPKSAVRGFIGEYIEDYMKDISKVSGFLHNHVDTFRNIILDAIRLSTVKTKKEKGNVDSWLDVFSSELGNKTNLLRCDFKRIKYQNVSEIDFLEEAMTRAVDIAVQKLHKELSTYEMADIQRRILTILTDDFPECWEQCPFCGAVCVNAASQHSYDHSVQYHRPMGLNGYINFHTRELVADICPSRVDSDRCFIPEDCIRIPYTTYRDVGAPYSEWSITPDGSSFLSYWKWFTCRFQSDIEKYYERRFETIPAQWREISKAKAVSEIEKLLK